MSKISQGNKDFKFIVKTAPKVATVKKPVVNKPAVNIQKEVSNIRIPDNLQYKTEPKTQRDQFENYLKHKERGYSQNNRDLSISKELKKRAQTPRSESITPPTKQRPQTSSAYSSQINESKKVYNSKQSPTKSNQIAKPNTQFKPVYNPDRSLPFKANSPQINKNQNQQIVKQAPPPIQAKYQPKREQRDHSRTPPKQQVQQITQTRTLTPPPRTKQNPLENIYYQVNKNGKYYLTELLHYHFPLLYNGKSPYDKWFEVEWPLLESRIHFRDLFRTHFIQSYDSIQFCMKLPQKDPVLIRPLPALGDPHRRTIVFDLDETLIHYHVIYVKVPHEEPVETRINIRPYCIEMLKMLSQDYEIILFTASHQSYADEVLELIDPKRQFFKYRFYRDSCLQLEEDVYTKDLRILHNRSLQNMLIVDNAAYSYFNQIDHGIPIIPFYDNKDDKELFFLTKYLLDLRTIQNIVQYNRDYFKSYLLKNNDQIEILKKITQ